MAVPLGFVAPHDNVFDALEAALRPFFVRTFFLLVCFFFLTFFSRSSSRNYFALLFFGGMGGCRVKNSSFRPGARLGRAFLLRFGRALDSRPSSRTAANVVGSWKVAGGFRSTERSWSFGVRRKQGKLSCRNQDDVAASGNFGRNGLGICIELDTCTRAGR